MRFSVYAASALAMIAALTSAITIDENMTPASNDEFAQVNT